MPEPTPNPNPNPTVGAFSGETCPEYAGKSADTRVLGRIVRLQVQRDPMKVGKAPLRRYEPSVLTSVESIEVTERGAVGSAGESKILDVHHQDHPASRDPKGKSGLTLMATGDYVNLRDTYGDHLTDGIAGESILIEADALAGAEFPDGLVVHTDQGALALTMVRVAEPCVEFTRFSLGQEPSAQVGTEIKQGLQDLDGGRRGYRAVAATAGVIRVGDTVRLP